MAAAPTLRKMLPYTTVAMGLAMLYTGWAIRSRIRSTEEFAAKVESKKLESDKKVLDVVGNDLKIITFYSSPTIHAGQKTVICYGVANAQRVHIEPEVEPVTPSLSRCVDVAPKKTTEYTLTAEDAAGHRVSQSLVIKVR